MSYPTNLHKSITTTTLINFLHLKMINGPQGEALRQALRERSGYKVRKARERVFRLLDGMGIDYTHLENS